MSEWAYVWMSLCLNELLFPELLCVKSKSDQPAKTKNSFSCEEAFKLGSIAGTRVDKNTENSSAGS